MGASMARRRRWVVFLLLLCVASGAGLAILWFRPRRIDPRRLRVAAAAAVKAERYGDAEKALNQLPSKRPLDWVLQSKVDLARGRPEVALADLAHVPDSDRLGALARYSEGVILVRHLHKARAGEAALLRALGVDPRAVQARKELCYLYYVLSMKAEFAAQFRALEALGGLTYEDVYHSCVNRRGGAEARRIVEDLKEFLAVDPTDRRCRLALAHGLRRLDRVTEAEDVLAVLPDSDTEAQAFRATLALDRGDRPKAQAILAAGAPGDPDLAPLRGRLALARRDAKEAVSKFQIAMGAHTDRRDVLLGMGRALAMEGNHAAAARYLAAAADLDQLELLVQNLVTPGADRDPVLLAKLGAACETLHRFPEARAWFSLAYTYNPSARNKAAIVRLAHQDEEADGDARQGHFRPPIPHSVPTGPATDHR
jgi:tetratricopeptide (TPR) repeat protein